MLISRYQAKENPLLSERRIELFALLLTLVLFLLLFFSVASLIISSHPAPKLPSADSLVGRMLRSSGVVSPEQSIAVRARPVFWPSRRPVDAPLETDENKNTKYQKGELDKVKLLGVFGAGDSVGIIALVQGKKTRILQGDKIAGWTLDSIERDQAVFVEGGQSQTLALERGAIVTNESVSEASIGSSTGTSKKLETKRTLTAGRASLTNEQTK